VSQKSVRQRRGGPRWMPRAVRRRRARTENAGEIAATIWGWSSPKGGAIMATGEAKVIDNAIIGFMQRRRCSPTPI
jgi:hypothetical protein